MRLSSPQAVKGEPIEEVAETDLWPEFGCQPRQSVSPIARADPTNESDDDEGIEGEAVAVVHRPTFFICSPQVKTLIMSPPHWVEPQLVRTPLQKLGTV
jgi:hypothetical protein